MNDVKRFDGRAGILCVPDRFELLVKQTLAGHAKGTLEAWLGGGEDGVKDIGRVTVVVRQSEEGVHVEDRLSKGVSTG